MKYALWIFFLCVAGEVFPKDMVGKVVAVDGTAKTTIKGRKERTLKRGSVIFTDEYIHVEGNSKLQIRFTDGGLLNLIPNSKYQIKSYSYTQNKSTNQYIGQVYKGGFRHLTGNIAKTNPSQVEVRTPTATIGVRGTVFEVLILPNLAMTVGCEFGQISVTNQAGTVDLGPSQPFQISTVTSPTLKPQGLSHRPNDFSEHIFASPPKGIETTPKGSPVNTAPPVRIKGGC
jgi:hypothetical protein